jgi:hypothetical protein
MVLSETRGLMAFFDCPGGHRVPPETRVFSNTGLTLPVATSPRNRASQEPDGHRQEMVPRDRTDSQPEALKLLVVSNSWRRNVPTSGVAVMLRVGR